MYRFLAKVLALPPYLKLKSSYEKKINLLFKEKRRLANSLEEREGIADAWHIALTHKSDLRKSCRLGVAAVAASVKGYLRGNLFPSKDVLEVGSALEEIVNGADIEDEAEDNPKIRKNLKLYKAYKRCAKLLIEDGESCLERMGVKEEYMQGKKAVREGQLIDQKFGRLLKQGKFEEVIKKKDEFWRGWQQKIGCKGIAYWLPRIVYDSFGGRDKHEKECIASHLGNCGQIWQIGDDAKDFIQDVKAFDDPFAELVPPNSIVIKALAKGMPPPKNSQDVIRWIGKNFDVVKDLYKDWKKIAGASLEICELENISYLCYYQGALDMVSHLAKRRISGLKSRLFWMDFWREKIPLETKLL